MKRFYSVVLVLFGFFTVSVSAEVVVIVNASSGISSVSKADLGRVFLGKSDALGGQKVVPLNQIESAEARVSFDQSMLNRNAAQIKSYWSRQLFSGEGTPPEELNGDLAILTRISQDAGAISYISPAALNESVKVVTVTD